MLKVGHAFLFLQLMVFAPRNICVLQLFLIAQELCV